MPAKPRDELVTVLLERLDRFEGTLSAVQQSLTRMEAAEQQAQKDAAEARAQVVDLQQRVSALEASKHRAEGAVWAWRVAVAALAMAGGAASHVFLGR